MSITPNEKELKIGIANLQYNNDGTIRKGYFEPHIMNIDKSVCDLNKCNGNTIEEVQSMAEILLAGYFNQLNVIELSDREKFAIRNRLIYASKYDTGKMKEVVIEFYFEEI